MFPKYGKQVTVKSEWFNLGQYVMLSDIAFRLLVRLTQLSDGDGNVDMDGREVAFRMGKPGSDMSPYINELTEFQHIETYVVDGHPYAAIVGHNDKGHKNYQPTHPSSVSEWRNPSPPWQDGPINATKRAPRSKKAISTDATEEEAAEIQEEAVQPRTEHRAPHQGTKRTVRVREVHVEGAGSPVKGSETGSPTQTPKKALKRPENRSERARGAVRVTTMADTLAEKAKRRAQRDARIAADHPEPPKKKTLRREPVVAEQFDASEYIGCSPEALQKLVWEGALTKAQAMEARSLKHEKFKPPRLMFSGYTD